MEALGRNKTTSRAVLWVPFYNTGEFVALNLQGDDHKCLPVFSSYFACLAWVRAIGLGDHVTPSIPLYPKHLLNVLEIAENIGFTSASLDPPSAGGVATQHTDIENLIEQVEDKL